MADADIVAAARTLKAAHMRVDVLGGAEHGLALSKAYADLLDVVGDVDEPSEVAAYRAEVRASSAQLAPESEATA